MNGPTGTPYDDLRLGPAWDLPSDMRDDGRGDALERVLRKEEKSYQCGVFCNGMPALSRVFCCKICGRKLHPIWRAASHLCGGGGSGARTDISFGRVYLAKEMSVFDGVKRFGIALTRRIFWWVI
jgi:hypothetical protein